MCGLGTVVEAEEWVQEDWPMWLFGLSFQHSTGLCEDTGLHSASSHPEPSECVLPAVPQPARLPQPASHESVSSLYLYHQGVLVNFLKHIPNMFILFFCLTTTKMCALSLNGFSSVSAQPTIVHSLRLMLFFFYDLLIKKKNYV